MGQAGTAAFGGGGVFHGKVIGPFRVAEYNRTRNVFCAGIAAYTRVSDRTEAAMSDNALSPQKNHRRLAETLVDRFAQRMRDGVLVRGEKLPSEIHIMEAEGVSRTVVRDALSRMQAAGLVETRHGVGTFVLDMPPPEGFSVGPATIATVADVLNLLEFRLSLEVEAAGLAAQRRSPEALLELKRAFDALLEGPQKSGTTINADFQFHLKIAKASGNAYLIDIMKHLGTKLIPRTRMNSAYTGQSDRNAYLAGINAEHRQIYNAIAEGNVDAARAAMYLHLNGSRMRLRRTQALYSD
ncbi:Transcriptional regulator, GntR family [Pseudomonas syringae pv. viburni]|uniref:Transcriptional regulator, GntR family n=1 Tax=Pseudomonas syringae pv. viburni TaxID=251703 RepID=A0A0Q0EP93_9PSED|nr:Transcriptional regulator, GntR family [Pseudomonas syringae pv. viburni]